MKFRSQASSVLVICLAVWGFVACSDDTKPPPPRDMVQQLLQQEAEGLKAEGEDVDPSLGMTITWEIQSVEVRELPEDEARPWEGIIRFQISSHQKDYNGKTDTETFDKEFHYVWDNNTDRWIIN
jgi:hypothetical protein